MEYVFLNLCELGADSLLACMMYYNFRAQLLLLPLLRALTCSLRMHVIT